MMLLFFSFFSETSLDLARNFAVFPCLIIKNKRTVSGRNGFLPTPRFVNLP